MKIYDVRFCNKSELPQLVDFIKIHWQSDHVFVKSIQMLDFQHFDRINNRYNFLIGYNNKTKEIDGILGIIPLSHFDPKLSIYNDTWGGIWKVRSDVHNSEISNLGANLFLVFNKYNSHASIGMSKIATVLHKIRKYKIGILNQYYILNKKIENFKIANVDHVDKNTDLKYYNYEVKVSKVFDIRNYSDSSFKETYYPQKSINYLYNRFQNHPIYKYCFWEISKNNLVTILVTRKVTVNQSSVLRIVDVYGKLENYGNLSNQFQEILEFENVEYIDILNFGIDNIVFNNIGFQKLDTKGNIIIPNYFEPFLRENIEINCAYRSTDNYVIFKADADQDRPSII